MQRSSDVAGGNTESRREARVRIIRREERRSGGTLSGESRRVTVISTRCRWPSAISTRFTPSPVFLVESGWGAASS
jgi:hypothetical protein